MATPWHTLAISTHRRVEVQDITDQVRASYPPDPGRNGLIVVICEHSTAGLCVNEAEPGLMKDIEGWLERLVPASGSFAHNTVDDNADAHLRAILLGHSVCVPLVNGTLGLGRWQRVLFVELDGPRKRRVWVKLVED